MNWEDIIKVRTKGPDGKWQTKVERDTELDRRGGGGGGGPNRGGQPSAPEDDEDQPYTKEGGMAEDEISTVYPMTMEEDVMVAENDEFCCEQVKEWLTEYVLESTPAENTAANIKKITNTIRHMNCVTISNLFESENLDKLRVSGAKLFGVDLYAMTQKDESGRLSMDDIIEQWQQCVELYSPLQNTNDLAGANVGLGHLTEGEIKPSERSREEHRDWKDAVVSPRKKIPRRKPAKRGWD